jgi:hypothetical protein
MQHERDDGENEEKVNQAAGNVEHSKSTDPCH